MPDKTTNPATTDDDTTIDTSTADDKSLTDDLLDDDGKALDKQPADDANKNADLGLLSDDDPKDDVDVPDQYVYEPPEGVEIDDDTQGRLDKFGEAAKGMSLTQAQYQALVEYEMSSSQASAEGAVNAWNERVGGWREASKTDKDIGGADFPKNVAVAEATIRQFGDKDLLDLMRSPTGDNPNGLALINHPAVLRAFTRIGNALGEPVVLEGDTKVEDQGSLKRLYPSMFKETT